MTLNCNTKRQISKLPTSSNFASSRPLNWAVHCEPGGTWRNNLKIKFRASEDIDVGS